MARTCLRAALTLIALVCFASLQSASAITEQVHNHGSHTDCCQICHAGHASAAQPALTLAVAAPRSAEWRQVPEAALALADGQTKSDSSRGPPR